RTPGGGGGSFGAIGARGGNNSPNNGSLQGDPPLAPFALIPLRGGCVGGYVLSNTVAGYPGGGGGAVQLVSRTAIKLTSSGGIDNGHAGGGGGGVGVIHVNTSSGLTTMNGAFTSGVLTEGTIGKR